MGTQMSIGKVKILETKSHGRYVEQGLIIGLQQVLEIGGQAAPEELKMPIQAPTSGRLSWLAKAGEIVNEDGALFRID